MATGRVCMLSEELLPTLEHARCTYIQYSAERVKSGAADNPDLVVDLAPVYNPLEVWTWPYFVIEIDLGLWSNC